MSDLFPMVVDKKTMASLLSLSTKQFGRYVDDGKMPTVDRKYPVPECIQAYVRIQTDMALRSQKPASTPDGKMTAADRKEEAEARLKEIKVQEQVGDLIRLDTANKLLEEVLTSLRSQLTSIPGAWTPSLIGRTNNLEMSLTLQRLTDDLMTGGIDDVVNRLNAIGLHDIESESGQDSPDDSTD